MRPIMKSLKHAVAISVIAFKNIMNGLFAILMMQNSTIMNSTKIQFKKKKKNIEIIMITTFYHIYK